VDAFSETQRAVQHSEQQHHCIENPTCLESIEWMKHDTRSHQRTNAITSQAGGTYRWSMQWEVSQKVERKKSLANDPASKAKLGNPSNHRGNEGNAIAHCAWHKSHCSRCAGGCVIEWPSCLNADPLIWRGFEVVRYYIIIPNYFRFAHQCSWYRPTLTCSAVRYLLFCRFPFLRCVVAARCFF
jgi:hypothetical protein